MSNKVDVLAVMNYASEVLDELGFTGRSSSLDKARAAVAELIEAASDHVNGGAIGAVAREERLLAALARVKGD